MIWVTLLALISCGVWNLIWILMGYMVGTNWDLAKATFTGLMFKYNVIAFSLLGLLIVLLIVRRLCARRKKT